MNIDNYQFITKTDPNPEFDDNTEYYFYQICKYKNKVYNKFFVRRFVVDSNLDFKKVQVLQYNISDLKKLILSLNDNQYKIYETADLNLINYPNYNDIYMLQSELLCKESNGFDKSNLHFVN